MNQHLNVAEDAVASIAMAGRTEDKLPLHGRFVVECVGADGVLKWREEIDNLVATVGVNLLFETLLAGSSYSVTGPYMGLIDLTSYTAIANADTMSSHAGWVEATCYSGSRPTCVWSAASARAKALSAALAFNINATATVKGLFIVLGTGASATVSNTSGTLFCETLFTGGDRAVQSGDVVNASYSISA